MKTTAALTAFLFASCWATLVHGVTLDWVSVGNPGNAGELSGWGAGGGGPNRICGGVDYTYRISKYEATTAQYVEFLNAVADSDPNGLYNTDMWSEESGCKIERTGVEGSYNYSIAADRANRPVNCVSFLDAMRFINWLENGQPTGAQDAGTTEDGVYAINPINDGLSEVRNPNATYFLPNDDEWYKAAYHKNDGVTGNYWDYATQSDIEPSNNLIDPDPGNNATFYYGDWPDPAGYTVGSPYWTTEVGEFENSASAYGTYDQCGNVWEWNESIILIDDDLYRGLRGGCFSFISYDMHANWTYGIGGFFAPTFESSFVGFRVASLLKPITLADLDNDGDVDGNDFLAWQRGESPNPLSAEDLAIWQAQFGTTSAPSSSTTIPEPSALIICSLLTFIGIVLTLCRIKQR
ncbi:MAG: SUMF1/EgtB/PvdO family nonheme iron enzyme [Pirellulales bacterium]|nr:SUMF1/EgtB/PvdO family nonheme iron enzyme [Pirellulales bacterium]